MQVLLGGLVWLEGMGVYGGRAGETRGSGDTHNTLQLAATHTRFSLLPLSIQLRTQQTPQPVISQTLYRVG